MSPTKQALPFASARQILWALLPPDCMVHIGWGNGLGEIAQWSQWPLANALIVESEDAKLSYIQTLVADRAGWKAVHATLAATPSECRYYLANNPSESGLLQPERLRQTWPHLSTVATRNVTATTLDALWHENELFQITNTSQVQTSIWIFIDCMPALDILTGAGELLRQSKVVCARCLLQDKAALAERMQQSNWIEVGWTESHHPEVGHSWFMRDLGQQQTQLNHALTDISTQLHQAQIQLDGARHHQTELASQLTTSLEQNRFMTEALESLAKTKEAETAAKNQALAERDALVKAKEFETAAKNQALAERDALTKGKDAEIAAKNQAVAERDALTKAKETETVAKNQALAERDALTKAKEAETTAKNQALAERDALAKARETETAAKKLALAELDALAKTKEAETAAKNKALAERDALTKGKEAETAAKNQALAERDALTKAKETETAAKNQALAERDALAKAKEAETTAKNQALAERDALAQEKQTLEARHKQSQDRLHEIEMANQDFHKRQHLLNEELVKAEAQIELIKDLLLREQGI